MGFLSNLSKAFWLGSTPSTPFPEETDNIAKSERATEAKAAIENPLHLINQLDYKDRLSSITFDTLKKMSIRNAVVAAVVLTRINQISTFSQPARFTKDGLGFEIRLRDPKKSPTPEQRRMMMALELFLENCGFDYDPKRDGFDTFIRKVLRDSLIYDQLTFEIVPDRLGRPAEFYAVDASTIRAGVIKADNEDDDSNHFITHTNNNGNPYDWVQVIDGQVVSQFTSRELAFAVRNARTDIQVQPYGFSELEMLIHQITSHLWAEEYNSKFFSQGGTTKGVLNLKGSDISREQLDAFRRQWMAQVSGMTGAWKTPVVSVDGLEYINVSQSNREMEFEMWMNYLINIVSAVYQIDPAEINFPNRGGAGGGGAGIMEGGMEQRLKNSKDKGLRPLLRFLESVINKNLIYRFSQDYTFNFVGLDQETEDEKAELNEKLVRTRKTINEIRKENDDPPIPYGDIILDPTYTAYVQQMQMAEQAQQQGDMQGGDEQPNPDEMDGDEVQEQEGNQQIEDSIDENFGKSEDFYKSESERIDSILGEIDKQILG